MYICPVCKKRLKKLDNVLHCQNGHSFDIARKGYVNLLTTVKRNPKNSGDNADMVKARTSFLDKNYYLALARRIAETAGNCLEGKKEPMIIDSGCGEGFYTCVYAQKLPFARIFGIDISKAAISHCMTRIHIAGIKNCEFAVASSFELPFIKESADMVISTFAPVSNDEYARVLKKGGKLIVISPSPKHLFELKSAAYDEPYENKPNNYGLNKFELSGEEIFEYKQLISSTQDILDLFSMTPYLYKTSAEGIERLKALYSLEVTCGFCIQVYTKKQL